MIRSDFLIILALLIAGTRVSARESTHTVPPDSLPVCNNPIVLNSLVVNNTTCGNSTGLILINVAGGQGNLSYTWQPAVSTTQNATNLVAGVYRVTIKRSNQPECQLDTILIVNNTDGPPVSVINIKDANCMALNGAISLAASNLTYSWSNGVSGPVNVGLAAGCYYATATAPNGCYSVNRYCLDNVNPLQTQAQVLKPAKCGRPTGQAQITVSGGSGVYSYNLPGSPSLTSLPAGIYTDYIADMTTGCLDTVTFTVPPANVGGMVDLTVKSMRCADGLPGSALFNVIAGSNFALPFSYTLTNAAGMPVLPSELPAGQYTLRVADADSCFLPVVTFAVTAPPPLDAQVSVQPGDCAEGGRIDLNITGGNGRYMVDWQDIPGYFNPVYRRNLAPGYYQAQVFDSLLCRHTIDSVLVKSACPAADTLLLVLGTFQTSTICLPVPPGSLGYHLPGAGGNTGSSAYGSWLLDPVSGCLTYVAGSVAGMMLDRIPVASASAIPGLTDTVYVAVTIAPQPPPRDTVYFTVPENQFVSICPPPMTPPFAQPWARLVHSGGTSGISDAYGAYAIDPVSGCLTFQAAGLTAPYVDVIDVAVCDRTSRNCRLVTYIPSVLSDADCLNGAALPAEITLETDDCETGAPLCLPIPYNTLNDWAVEDNDAPYQGELAPCLPDTLLTYNLADLGGNGPYRLRRWIVNGQPISGYFGDRYDLLRLLQKGDPNGGWTLVGNGVFAGGASASTYGILEVETPGGLVLLFQPGASVSQLGSEWMFLPGQRTVAFRNRQTGCLDTVRIQVRCLNCPPLHPYTPNAQGLVELSAGGCNQTVNFCTSISVDEVNRRFFKDGNPVTTLVDCDNSTVGIPLDTGFHQLVLINTLTTCADTLTVWVKCDAGPPDPVEPVVVYTGISPNGDGANDTWRIEGIEQFPDSEVQVFGRWGNRVFYQKGYNNQNGWDGRWEGQDLPDGTYFYRIDLGNGAPPLSGYLQINR